MNTCTNTAEFGVRTQDKVLAACGTHLKDAVAGVPEAYVRSLTSQHQCQVPRKFPFGFRNN